MKDYYEYENDNYYCYPDTHVLKNKLGITDGDALNEAERKITSLRTAQFLQKPVKGKYDFDLIKKIHKFLFSDIYDWAGKTRNVNISKGDEFCRCEYIEDQMNDVMHKLEHEKYLHGLNKEQMADRLAFYLGEINAVHPFREGNGRTQRIFIELLANQAGYDLNFKDITQEEMVEASKQAFHLNYNNLTDIMLRALSTKK